MTENMDAASIWRRCRSQYIMSMGGPVDVNHLAIHAAMELYEVEDRVDCFEKVLMVSGHFLEKMRNEQSK